MTENEAKKKWCPMSRTGMMFATNRSENGCINGVDHCIASDCMMWKWETLYVIMPASGQIAENGRSKTNGCCGLTK